MADIPWLFDIGNWFASAVLIFYITLGYMVFRGVLKLMGHKDP